MSENRSRFSTVNRGNRGNRRRMNSNENHYTQPIGSKEVDKELNKEKEEILRRRRERFANDSKRSENNYGLISRGEDLTLKHDKSARLKLYNSTIKRINNFQQEDSIERDVILMSFRKLRESIVSLNEERKKNLLTHDDNTDINEEDLQFFRNVYMESIKFGIQFGKSENYVPAIQWILPIVMNGEWGFSEADKEFIILEAVEQIAIREKRYEEGLLLLNQHIKFRFVDLNQEVCDKNACCSPNSTKIDTLYLKIVQLINSDGITPKQQKMLSYRGSEKFI